jgi:hypothetical protein
MCLHFLSATSLITTKYVSSLSIRNVFNYHKICVFTFYQKRLTFQNNSARYHHKFPQACTCSTAILVRFYLNMNFIYRFSKNKILNKPNFSWVVPWHTEVAFRHLKKDLKNMTQTFARPSEALPDCRAIWRRVDSWVVLLLLFRSC